MRNEQIEHDLLQFDLAIRTIRNFLENGGNMIFCACLIICTNVQAAQDLTAMAETQVSQSQLIRISQVPSIQKELQITSEQLSRIAEITVCPTPVTFAEAIAPMKNILTDQQITEFKRIAFQGLMVRAFGVSEVRDSLKLTREQMTAVQAIQAELKNRLQPIQDKLKKPENVDQEVVQRDIAPFHELAYAEALDLLTVEQRKKWDQIARPVPVRGK